MQITLPTLATVGLVTLGVAAATPVLVGGFRRRGKGVRYERNFLVQRAPQFASLLDIALVTGSFLALNGVWPLPEAVSSLWSQWPVLPEVLRDSLAWAGVAVLASGLVFMIGGWYSLGECFSTDAEVLEGQTVRKSGLLAHVMHPAYSGIIQSLLGASIASLSLGCVLFTALVVAPLWLNRAKYEEQLLIETFGQSYLQYGQELKWRRLIPKWFPIGV